MDLKRIVQSKLLDISQLLINQLYDKYGLTDDVFDLQVKLNTMRAETDISDNNEIVNDEGFVQ